LHEVPSEIFDLGDSLEVLDLANNSLSTLPSQFATLSKLKVLFLSGNHFTEVPTILSQCRSLEMLGMKGNQIRVLPEDSLPPSLWWLTLTDNQIEEIPESIGALPRLQKLLLAGNRIQELPSTLVKCANLELIRLSANQITALPDWLLTMPRLSWLAFAGNQALSIAAPKISENPVLWRNLQIKESLGTGASGNIYRAEWLSGNGSTTPVAVKVFKGSITSDGYSSDELLACQGAGTHPNLISPLGLVIDHPENRDALVLRLTPTHYKNLAKPPDFSSCTRDVYDDNSAFSLVTATAIAKGVASAARHLHARGILHGDLYAHNTLVSPEGHALLGDFGAATMYDPSNVTTAPLLERIEVRAFGILLSELLDRASVSNDDSRRLGALRALVNECVSLPTASRPSFERIVQLL
jgi:hypothetical protein